MHENYDGFIFDLDGTIYLENQIIEKANTVINTLKENKKKIVFVSNKTTGSIDDYYHLLRSNGINADIEEFLTSTYVTQKFLAENFPKKNFFAIGEQVFIDAVKEVGLIYSNNPNDIDIVLITLDRTLNYSKLEIAARALDNGAKFFAANIDNTCPVEDGEILDAGSTISALEKRTNRKLEKHFGKPSDHMIEEALKKLQIQPNKCLIIGDRLETDIAMGFYNGIDTALVNSGISNNFEKFDNITPTYKLSSIADIL